MMKQSDRLKLYGSILAVALVILIYTGSNMFAIYDPNFIWNDDYPMKSQLDSTEKGEGASYTCVWGKVFFSGENDVNVIRQDVWAYGRIPCASNQCREQLSYDFMKPVSELFLYEYFCEPTEYELYGYVVPSEPTTPTTPTTPSIPTIPTIDESEDKEDEFSDIPYIPDAAEGAEGTGGIVGDSGIPSTGTGTTFDCPTTYIPVCGVNGYTYVNECFLLEAGIAKDHDGDCFACGNGLREPGEDCEQGIVPKTCEDFGFVGGELGCSQECNYDTYFCEVSICGNGKAEEGENYANCCQDIGCPLGYTCTVEGCEPDGLKDFCFDGTPAQTCSNTYPGYFCDKRGMYVEDYIQCGGDICIPGQTMCSDGKLSKCYNYEFYETQECAEGCKDSIQCKITREITIPDAEEVINWVVQFVYPESNTNLVNTKSTTKPRTFVDWITFPNIALVAVLFVVLLVIKDTYQGKIKWKIVLKNIKNKLNK